jgi:MoaA/NifB/PqqE/SkfB family radical SAM enzyme
VVKFNSFDPALQDRLAGHCGAARIIREALDRLGRAGYPAPERVLAVSTIICRQNYDELPDLWRWARDRAIAPYVEIITPQANACQNPWLHVPPADLRNYRLTIKGPCRSCELAATCYGCRGAAYQLTGDYLASDPLCWRNTSSAA